MERPLLDVMEATLGMPSDLPESAIHGLAHMPHARGRAEAIPTFLCGALPVVRARCVSRAAQNGCVPAAARGSVNSVRPAGSVVEEVVWTCTVLPS